MLSRFLLFPAVLCVALLGGCVTRSSVPALPSSLGLDGLMVARVYIPGSTFWQNAQVDIDGRPYNASLRDGYIAIALPPGEHRLHNLRVDSTTPFTTSSYGPAIVPVKGGGGGYRAPIYIPGSSYTIYYRTLSVERSFVVEANKVVNLGLMVYVAADDSKQTSGQTKQYYNIPLDNSAEMRHYLETNYSGLMASLKERNISLAPGKYLESARLPDLRRLIALEEARKGKLLADTTTSLAYGDAGTLVMRRLGPGAKPVFEVLDTGTLAPIVEGLHDRERFVFLSSDAKLLTVEHGKLTTTVVPFRTHPVRLLAVGKAMAIVDNRMGILTTQDRGQTWSKFDGAMIDDPRNDMDAVTDTHGVFVYLGKQGMPSAIVHLPESGATPRVIALPPPSQAPLYNKWNTLAAKPSGLFIEFAQWPDFYFLSRSDEKWSMRAKPKTDCGPIDFDDVGQRLKTTCEGEVFESADTGRTWARVAI
jgi:hypothetical protein